MIIYACSPRVIVSRLLVPPLMICIYVKVRYIVPQGMCANIHSICDELHMKDLIILKEQS